MSDDLEKSLETVAKGGGILLFGTILGIFLAMINQILLGRFLGVESYGLFYLAFSIISVFVPFSQWGICGSLPQYLPFHYSRGEKDVMKSAIHFSELLILCTSIIFCIIIYLFSDELAKEIFHNSELSAVLKYFAFALPLISLNNLMEAIVRSFKAVKYKVALFDVGIWLIRITIFVPFIVMSYSLFGAIVSVVIANFIIFVIAFFLIGKKIFPNQSKYQKVAVAKKLLIFSWPIAIAAIITLFLTKTDVLLLGYYFSSTEVGIYMPALLTAQYVILFGTPFAYIFLPVVSELFGKVKMESVESLFKSASKWIFLMALPVFIYILLFPKEIISVLYGAEYSRGYFALIILATGISMNAFTGISGGILVGSGHTKLNLTVEIIAAITNVSLNVILIPLFGIIGAAIGTSASFFSRNIASLAFVYKINKIHPFNKKYVGVVFSGLIVFVVFYLFKNLVFSSISSSLFIIPAGILLLGLYIMLILVFRCLDKNDVIFLELITKKLKINVKMFKKFIDFK